MENEARKVEAIYLQMAAAMSEQETSDCQNPTKIVPDEKVGPTKMVPDEKVGNQAELHTQDMLGRGDKS